MILTSFQRSESMGLHPRREPTTPQYEIVALTLSQICVLVQYVRKGGEAAHRPDNPTQPVVDE